MLTKEKCREFRVEFEKAVEQLEKKLGMKIEIGNIGFDDVRITTKLTATMVDGEGAKEVGESEILSLKLALNSFKDLPTNLIGLRFKTKSGRTGKLAGYYGKSRKSPIKVIVDGMTYKEGELTLVSPDIIVSVFDKYGKEHARA
jgi:hypothetical protein